MPSVQPFECRNMNAREDDSVRAAIAAANRKRLIVGGLLTEACVTFPVLSALKEGFEVFVVGDACGGLSLTGHDLALRRMEAAGAKILLAPKSTSLLRAQSIGVLAGASSPPFRICFVPATARSG